MLWEKPSFLIRRKKLTVWFLVSGDSSDINKSISDDVSSNEEVTITETNSQDIPVVVETYSSISSIDMTKIFNILVEISQ